jgi:Mce-associated membrane protein
MSDERTPVTMDAMRASPARIYDWLLGGKDNFEVDREAGARLLDAQPLAGMMARANRGFLERSVRALAAAGVRQFLDLGTGLPTSPNVHEIALAAHPDARIVYVDNDPLVAAHNDALRAKPAGVAAIHADVRSDPAVRNTALTDSAATSEVKGAVADMVGKLFSYNYTDPGRTDAAARTYLSGAAVRQYATLMNGVRTDAPKQKTVLSTRVTDSAVVSLRDGRARLLVYADQQTSRTSDGKSTTSPAMLSVTAVRHSRNWRITNLNTFQP